MTSTYSELQNWAGDTLKPIELIGINSRSAKIHQKAQEQTWLKRNQISALISTQRPPDDWPDALDYLVIGLVANKYIKLGKPSENFYLVRGCSI